MVVLGMGRQNACFVFWTGEPGTFRENSKQNLRVTTVSVQKMVIFQASSAVPLDMTRVLSCVDARVMLITKGHFIVSCPIDVEQKQEWLNVSNHNSTVQSVTNLATISNFFVAAGPLRNRIRTVVRNPGSFCSSHLTRMTSSHTEKGLRLEE